MTKQKFDAQTIAKITVLFVISYIILYLSSTFFYKWDSPMFFLPPIVGFFFAYFLIDWIDEFFESRAAHAWYFPVLIIVLALAAEYIALFWYYNWGRVIGQQGMEFDFINEFRASAFLPFVLACVLGWLSHLIIDSTAENKPAHERKTSKAKK